MHFKATIALYNNINKHSKHDYSRCLTTGIITHNELMICCRIIGELS